MAPKRKSRSVNRRLTAVYDVSTNKGGPNSKTSSPRKRKLSDILGSEWSKEELERFYEAFRKYGKNWKKVSAAVPNRSADMVEALYSMNRAYLSLPEGTASVVGLIAMMTDHYCNQEGSDSGQESNDGGAASRKSQKLAQGKARTSTSKGHEGPLHRHTSASNSDCLSLLKKNTSENQPRAVGKRTPRVPVSFSYDKGTGGRFFSPTRQGSNQKVDTNDDDVAHEVALTLAQVSQRGESPQESHKPNKRTGSVRSSPACSGDIMDTDLELTVAKFGKKKVRDEDGIEGSLGTKRGGKLLSPENRRLYVKKRDMDYGTGRHLDEIREVSSETEGQNFRIKGGKVERTAPQASRKKREKVLYSTDEGSEFDALQTLADLSLMMPTMSENESSVQAEEGDVVADKSEISGLRAKGKKDVAKMSKSGKVSGIGATSPHKTNEESQQSMSGRSRKKQKMFVSKIPVTELRSDTQLRGLQEAEVIDAGNKLKNSDRRFSDSPLLQKQEKLVRHTENSYSNVELREEKDESVPSTAQAPTAYQVDLSKKVRSKRKQEFQKPQNSRDLIKFLSNNKPNSSNPSVHRAPKLQVTLSNCLSNYQVRRWCAFEWFYSAIDYPWFAKKEFVEYLNHVGLGHIPRLTRVEWGVIRSSLGKPRRFSEQFLKEEKEKLNQYRYIVREHYSELREGTREGLPTDLARPLFVGQRVMAIHPRTREIHEGNILTVDHNRFRVQFHRAELGVEFVLDIDCMPSNPVANMPASIAGNKVATEELFASFNDLNMRGVAKDQKLEGSMKISSDEAFKHGDVASHVLSDYLLNQVKAQKEAEEADVQALAELRRALDKKEAVVSELRQMNDALLASRREGDTALKDSESFKKPYAAVVVQLDEVNNQVTQALQDWRKGSTYGVISQPLCPKSAMGVGDSVGQLNSFDSHSNQMQESRSLVDEIVESSRKKARNMVDTAAQAISSLNRGGNSVDGIEETIDHISNRLSVGYSPADPVHRNSASPNGPVFELKNALDRTESEIPSELISNCVATLSMIQKCTEREFPPEDVARILDSAALSLQPCCSQNLAVYGEIQKCIGIIRNQILALVPN